MKATKQLFFMGLRLITRDGMMFVLLPAPFLVAGLFRFGLPLANTFTEDKMQFSIARWFGLADGLSATLSPLFIAMVCAFLILEERDENIISFYQITPIAGSAFLIARLGLPMIWAFVSAFLVLAFFSLTNLTLLTVICAAFLCTTCGLVLAMMVVAFASNRVEGLAISKLLGVTLAGLLCVWLVPAPYSYFSAFLPSFWIGLLMRDGAKITNFIPAMLLCVFWLGLFTKRFLRKTQ